MTDFQIRTKALTGFRETVIALGGSPDELLASLDLPVCAVEDPDSFIPYESFIGLLNRASETLECPHFGLLLAAKKDASQLGALSLIVETSATIFDALSMFTRYLHYQSHSGTLSLRTEDEITYWSHTIHYRGKESVFQASQHAMGVGLGVLRLVGGNDLSPLAAYSTFDKPKSDVYVFKNFRSPVYYNAEFNGCTFNTKDLQKPLQKADSVLNQALRDHVKSIVQESGLNFKLKLKDVIKHAMIIGDPSIDRVANYLSMTRRTFQRDLEKRGLYFKDLLDDVRLETAKHHLKYSTLSLAHIADMLGYSDPSALSRFFSNKTGSSPRKWRNAEKLL